MKPVLTSIAALCLVQTLLWTPAHAADAVAAPAEESAAIQAGLAVVIDLAQLNGQALACQEMTAASQAKKLMLAHAPKTPRFGNAFEETTNSSYLAQARGTAPCPDASALTSRLDVLAQRLQTTLPPAPVGGK